MPGLIVVGAGPGIAASVARRFAAANYPIGLISRSRESVDSVAAGLDATDVKVVTATADASREAEIVAALDRVVTQLGVPDVVAYNAGRIQADRPGELSNDQHQAAYAVNVLGALTTASHLAPKMAAAGGGSIIITGGMPHPSAAVVSLSLGKAAVRALTSMLAEEYGPSGVHVATVTVGGAVAPGTAYDPDRIAEHYWRLHNQPPGSWELEVAFNGE